MNQKSGNHSLLILFIAILQVLFSACGSSKNISKEHIYFQNGMDTVVSQSKETIIQANDLMSIQVFSKTLNQEQAAIFNIPATTGDNNKGYQVNTAGNIELPVVGSIRPAGFTTQQLQSEIAQKITSYVKNPSVPVLL